MAKATRGPKLLEPKGALRTGRPAPSAILLAAGASSRFPGTKQLARIGGKTLVERALDSVPASEVRETVVVLGYDAASVSEAVAGLKGVTVVVNADYRAGLGSSIRAGILALAKDTNGAMIMLADQPFISRSLLHRLLRVFEGGGSKWIVATAQGDLATPPAIFPKRYFGELVRLRGDQGARSVIRRHASDVSLVRVRSRRTLEDIDTRDDLEEARRLLEP